MPRFQRRSVYMTPLQYDGPPALCYVGPDEAEKRVPLASISSVMFENERKFEFSIDATSRKHKLFFRASNEAECYMCAGRCRPAQPSVPLPMTAPARPLAALSRWIDGISLLLSLSDFADYVPL